MPNYKGVEVDFTGTKPKLSLAKTSASTDVQNILVNIATAKDPNGVFPLRGTDLLKKYAETGFVSIGSAQHKANFAAMDTKTFFNSTRGNNLKSLDSIVLEVSPVSISSLGIKLRLGFSDVSVTTLETNL
jgi:hypothetical protein